MRYTYNFQSDTGLRDFTTELTADSRPSIEIDQSNSWEQARTVLRLGSGSGKQEIGPAHLLSYQFTELVYVVCDMLLYISELHRAAEAMQHYNLYHGLMRFSFADGVDMLTGMGFSEFSGYEGGTGEYSVFRREPSRVGAFGDMMEEVILDLDGRAVYWGWGEE